MPADRVTSDTPWHVVLLVDDSGSMEGAGAAAVNEGLRAMISEMEVIAKGTKPYFKVSLIAYGSELRVLCEAVGEKQVDLDAIATFAGASGTTDMAGALELAGKVLERHPGKPTDFRPYVWLFTDGRPDDPARAEAAAGALKALALPAGSPTVVAVGVGDVEPAFLKRVATNPEFAILKADPRALVRIFPAIGTIVGSRSGEAAINQAIVNL
jgi:uncharacterized protein YegL